MDLVSFPASTKKGGGLGFRVFCYYIGSNIKHHEKQ